MQRESSMAWKDMMKVGEKQGGEDLYERFWSSCGTGSCICFWPDAWVGDTPLAPQFQRDYMRSN